MGAEPKELIVDPQILRLEKSNKTIYDRLQKLRSEPNKVRLRL